MASTVTTIKRGQFLLDHLLNDHRLTSHDGPLLTSDPEAEHTKLHSVAWTSFHGEPSHAHPVDALSRRTPAPCGNVEPHPDHGYSTVEGDRECPGKPHTCLDVLAELRDSLPDGHQEKDGLLRAIEVLRYDG